MRQVGLFFVCLCMHMIASAQKTQIRYNEDGNRILGIQFHYTLIEPGGDLAKRFGTIHQVGGGVHLKTSNNWLFAIEGAYQFGNDIKETNLLQGLANTSGYINNNGGFPANIAVSQRGLYYGLDVGKLFRVFGSNANSGILITMGIGYYQHKIHIATPQNDVASLTADLRRGYDRQTAGLAIDQFIGYQHYSYSRFYNFYFGIQLSQAFTKSVRGFNYDLNQIDNERRLDLLYGFRVGWIIPIYLGKGNKDEYYFK